MMSAKTYMNWSGGKDSSLALHKILLEGLYPVDRLLTTVNAVHNRISMHGVKRELLERQSQCIGIRLQTVELPEQPSMGDYERLMGDTVAGLAGEGYSSCVFGDIFLEDLRAYREEKLRPEGIACVFPLWKIATDRLMKEFLELGFKAVVVCVNEQYLDKSFCGRLIDESFVSDLPPNVDICGENGEYHSFVFDGPIFHQAVEFQTGDIVRRTYAAPASAPGASAYGFYFCDLHL